MNTISLCCTSHKTNPTLMIKMIASAIGFNEIVLHMNGSHEDNPLPDIKVDTRFREIRTEKLLTSGEGFNAVIRCAVSEWVCCMCDDDFFHTENLRELLTYIRNNHVDADIIQFPCYVGNEVTNVWEIWGQTKGTYQGLREHNMISFSSFYRKPLWSKVNGYINCEFNDWLFWLNVLKSGARILQWDKPIYYFRQGIEERLSDKERHSQDFDVTRKKILGLVQ